MQELDDHSLLNEYVERGSEAAFAELVGRHINKVYSVALRHTGNPAHAEEITQAVFVILAKKSGHLRRGVIISGWLYQTARLTAVTFLRSEIRRARREQEAHMQRLLNESEPDLWRQIAPLLDAGMARLNEKDRHAIVLRFFDGKSMSEVGAALGANEDAAKKRVGRALEKLRKFFTKRGVSSTTALIAGAISTQSVQAAPAVLAKSITLVAVTKDVAASGSTLTLIKGALKLMAWTKAKTAVVAVGVLLIGSGAVIVKNDFFPGEPSYQGRRLSEWLLDADYGQPQDKRAKAYEAIRKMGAKTLPFLISDLTPGKTAKDAGYRQATWGFDALGSIGKPAIPKLTKLLEENPGYVPIALANIGPEALPELFSALTNESFFVRDNTAAGLANAIFSGKITSDQASAAFSIALNNLTYTDTNNLYQANTRSRAAWLLAALKQRPDLSVPALIHGLQDSNLVFASDCAFALGQFGKDSKVAVPELTDAANSTNRQLSVMAKQSLGMIQNAR
ncbi:MAG TPA: sigma-70 family RNA polymerase sigma factor [Verrucomicrobiae bacterium]|jgi:RNA polymerase sigma factor (sigma-70 family)|nr:sigma-70 family RNA polymerase sigma factor [Verrucomicrobiae bacterium]